jgi:hypothetical protein
VAADYKKAAPAERTLLIETGKHKRFINRSLAFVILQDLTAFFGRLSKRLLPGISDPCDL